MTCVSFDYIDATTFKHHLRHVRTRVGLFRLMRRYGNVLRAACFTCGKRPATFCWYVVDSVSCKYTCGQVLFDLLDSQNRLGFQCESCVRDSIRFSRRLITTDNEYVGTYTMFVTCPTCSDREQEARVTVISCRV